MPSTKSYLSIGLKLQEIYELARIKTRLSLSIPDRAKVETVMGEIYLSSKEPELPKIVMLGERAGVEFLHR